MERGHIPPKIGGIMEVQEQMKRARESFILPHDMVVFEEKLKANFFKLPPQYFVKISPKIVSGE